MRATPSSSYSCAGRAPGMPMTLIVLRPSSATTRSTESLSIRPGMKTRAAPSARKALPRTIASVTRSSSGPVPRTRASVRALSWNGTPFGLRGGDDGGDACDRLVEGLEPVFDVRPDHAQRDRAADRLARFGVAVIQVGGHRQVGGPHDRRDALQGEVEGHPAVGVAVHRRDGVPGGGDGRGLRKVGDDLRRCGIPDVHQADDLGGSVQGAKQFGFRDGVGLRHAPTLPRRGRSALPVPDGEHARRTVHLEDAEMQM